MTISLATADDIEEIMSFINSEWKEGHILARDKSFFKYEHQSGENINFVIAKNAKNKIEGVLGFIRYSLSDFSDIATVIWKVKNNNKSPALGIQLLRFLQNTHGIRSLSSVGINKKTIGIYKYLGIYTDSLKHYVLINSNITQFQIAKVNQSCKWLSLKSSLEEIKAIKILEDEKEISEFEFDKYVENIPYKNASYFVKRYVNHPVYKYKIYSVHDYDKISGLFVTRVDVYNGAKVLRIVDFIGDEKCIKTFALYLLDQFSTEEYEYADFYCFGLDEQNLLSAGFHLINEKSENLIIPNYFNPYERKNIRIHFCADTENISRLRIFKADGDQDRPS